LQGAETTIGGHAAKSHHITLSGDGVPPRQATLLFRQDTLFFTNVGTDNPASLNGNPVTFSQLADGDELELASHRLRVQKMAERLAVLEGYSDPYQGRQWPVGKEPMTIGRPGRRVNSVELNDRTVSREQATVAWTPDGFTLTPETANSPIRVNGEAARGTVPLADGDLIQLGQQLLRLRVSQGKEKRRDLIPQEATILFSDIWNYSSFAENRPLEDTILQMNEFYRALGKVIAEHGGVLLTFLGDAMMAVFGSDGPDPEAPIKAVKAALAMQARLIALNHEWAAAGKPSMRIGVGINSGEVMVGDVGFTGKFEFAAMGDNTNLAARIEKLTREFDAKIIVSGSTRRELDDSFLLSELGRTKVKGRESEVTLYRVDGRAGEGEQGCQS
jgi:class 3 adenylate cyclase